MTRVAVGAIFTESNHLVGTMTGLSCFERTELRRGEEILSATSGVLGGMLAHLRQRNIEIVPLIYASAVPGGPLTRDCYLGLKNDLLARLSAALPVDGVLMPQHGAAAVENIGSLDSDLLAAVRVLTGPATPIVATLDCHAHVTPQMVENADALLAWETYPHRDTYTTGVRGARLLADQIEGKVRPAMAMAKVPVIVGGFMGSTDDGPFAEVMHFAKSFESRERVLSTSAFLVQPHLDLPGMGGGGLVITGGDMDLAVQRATSIAQMYWDRRFLLETKMSPPAAAISEGMRIPGGPVLLLETADCIGGGASGDSAGALRALLDAQLDGLSLVPVVDPHAAALCHRHAVGDTISLAIGHQLDPRWGSPVHLQARIETLTDGRFTYSGGIWEGQPGLMGPSARLRTGNVEILVTSLGTYDWADEQFRSAGMDPGAAKFVVVKNPMNYRIGYAGRHRAAFVLDTPGPTPASIRNVPFQRLQRPYFPLDTDIPGLQPVILRGR